jgi:hypothetical protein
MNDASAQKTIVDNYGSKNGTSPVNLTSVSGKINTALSFDGSTQYATYDATGFPTGTANKSVTCWFKFTGTGNYTPWGYGTLANTKYFGMYFSGKKVGVSQYGDSLLSAADWNDGAWHHYTCVVTGSAYQIFVDSVSKGTRSMTTNTTLNTANIACFGDLTLKYPGSLDDLRFYSTALTQGQINIIYNGGTGTEEEAFTITTTGGSITRTVNWAYQSAETQFPWGTNSNPGAPMLCNVT